MTKQKIRCFGSKPGEEFFAEYHDNEWGTPSHDDKHLFEMLILEGAQAGLSWITVLKKRRAYRKAFHNFVPRKVASMTDSELEVLLQEFRYYSQSIKNKCDTQKCTNFSENTKRIWIF